MRSSVIGIRPVSAISLKNGMTLPLEPKTFPYRTTEKEVFGSFESELPEMKSLSEHNFVAPYKFAGFAALSELNAITR
jgi:hypothetical protein